MKRTLVFSHSAPVLVMAMSLIGGTARAQDNNCANLPDYATLKPALVSAVAAEASGLHNQMWATIVDRDGVVCAVAYSGNSRGAQWPGSRVISAQKANTANAFSLDASSSSSGAGQPAGLALSTANLYAAVQPGGSLYGLQQSNPVDTTVAYGPPSLRYGQFNDPMVGKKIGGVNVFGGGLALYGANHVILGGLGVSGDTSCTDHDVAWRLRHSLGFDHMLANPSLNMAGVAGVSGDASHPDNIVYDIGDNGQSKGGFGHPSCLMPGDQTKLPPVIP